MKKFKFRKFIFGLGALCISIAVLTIIFCNLPNKNSYMDKLNSMENTSSASMEFYAETLDELNNLSDLIIEGKVVDYKPKLREGGYVVTNETVEVKKVIKGNVFEGDKINVVFFGGELNEMTTPPFKDCPIMDMRGNYMLYLKTNDGVNYFIVGGNQGFGLIKNNKIEATDQGVLGDVVRGYKVNELEESIKNSISKDAK